MTCTKYVWANDQNGDALPFTAMILLARQDGSTWQGLDRYYIPPGGYVALSGLEDYPKKYKVVPYATPSPYHEEGWEQPNEKSFTCRSSDITLVYTKPTPPPTTGTLQVRVYHDITKAYLYNVAVYVDNTYRGVTLGYTGLIIPDVSIGFHTVLLVATGYANKTIQTYVGADGTVLDEGMTPSDGTLAVGSTPHGARIYVDDVYRGITPDPASPAGQYNYITLPAGTYNVKLTLDGYKDATTAAQVEGGKTTYYTPVLEAATGEVYVTAKDDDGNAVVGAEIYVDGVATGVLTPGTVTVSAGSHEIYTEKDV